LSNGEQYEGNIKDLNIDEIRWPCLIYVYWNRY
jgi:hypothetical protein